jgi:hypothetical protein
LGNLEAVDRWVLEHGGGIEGDTDLDRVYVLPSKPANGI